MGINWVTALQGKTVEDVWKYLSIELKSAIDAHIPMSCSSKNKKLKIWMNRAAMAKQKKKYMAWKHYTETGNSLNYIRATQEKNELKEMTRNVCADFEHVQARNIMHNPKAFWKYSETKFKAKSKLGDLLNSNGELTCDDTEKTNILYSTFTSVFTREITKYIPTLDNVFNGAPLQDLSISQQMVENKLSKLKTNKSLRPDGFHSRVLKETASSIGLPLSILYNMSLTGGHAPHAWKEGNITPIYQKKTARQMQESIDQLV